MGGQFLSKDRTGTCAHCNYSSVTNGEWRALKLADLKQFLMLEFNTNSSTYTGGFAGH